MKVRQLLVSLVALGALSAVAVGQPEFFDSSLHKTRAGKDYWYGAANGGFEAFTNVPIADLGCIECHGPMDANGNEYPEDYSPDCSDCHQTEGAWEVEQSQCLSCHGRQAAEINRFGYSDVHRDAGRNCWFCHTEGDLHGDGTEYDSMLQTGAIDVECEDCHEMDPDHGGPHNGKIHCASCHAQSVISCYNCHFESQVEAHVKRPVQPINDFVMLVNREKDGKVYPGSFQSLTYQGDSFVAFGPFSPHTITREGRTCDDCHVNFGGDAEAIVEYNNTGRIVFADWDDDLLELSWKRGIVPLPQDYEVTFRMDFVTFNGDPSDPPSNDWSSIGEDTWDGHQLFFATPLTYLQMEKLGMVPPCPGDIDSNGVIDFADILPILADWGGEYGPADVNGDGVVDFADILVVLGNWGPCGGASPGGALLTPG